MLYNRKIALCLSLLLALPAQAQEGTRYAISSGTGFFISMNGYVITNAHVVNGCEKAIIKGDMKRTVVDIVATDPAKDLALLRTDKMPQFAAPLRDNIKDLKKGDKALVMGYPGNHAITGNYALVDTEVLDVVGPLGNPDAIQFTDAAQKGNSGGPLLDLSGNVIGVIMGKSEVYRLDPKTNEKITVRNSDIAISLSVLKDFLTRHGVYARDLVSSMDLSRERIVDHAKYYIVNVQCAPTEASMDPSIRNTILQDLSTEPDAQDMQEMMPEATMQQLYTPVLPPRESTDRRRGLVIYDKSRDDQ